MVGFDFPPARQWAVYEPPVSVHVGAALFGDFAGPEASFFIFDQVSTGVQLSGSNDSRAFSLAVYRPADGIHDLSPLAGVPVSLNPSSFADRNFWIELYEPQADGSPAIGGVRGVIDGYAGPDRLPDGGATGALLVLGLTAMLSLPRRRA